MSDPRLRHKWHLATPRMTSATRPQAVRDGAYLPRCPA